MKRRDERRWRVGGRRLPATAVVDCGRTQVGGRLRRLCSSCRGHGRPRRCWRRWGRWRATSDGEQTTATNPRIVGPSDYRHIIGGGGGPPLLPLPPPTPPCPPSLLAGPRHPLTKCSPLVVFSIAYIETAACIYMTRPMAGRPCILITI